MDKTEVQFRFNENSLPTNLGWMLPKNYVSIVVYDVSQRFTLSEAKSWVKLLDRHGTKPNIVAFVGCKAGVGFQRAIKYEVMYGEGVYVVYFKAPSTIMWINLKKRLLSGLVLFPSTLKRHFPPRHFRNPL